MDRRAPAVAVFALAAVVTLSACGDDGSTAATPERTTTTRADATSTTGRPDHPVVTVPADFPTGVPLPQALRLGAASPAGTGDHDFRLSYALGATSPGDAMDAYETALDTAGYAVTKVPGFAASESHPSPLQADRDGWHVVARIDDTTLTLTVDHA